MAEAEFELIRRYFMRPGNPDQQDSGTGVICDIGDDGAVVRLSAGHDLVISTDTLVSGVHFPPDTSAAAIGHKVLAVNLSDLAAMGAAPRWATLSLTLPDVDEGWLAAFSASFFKLADAHKVQLVGGDTTQGPLTITVTLHGEVPCGMQLTRSGAQPGDRIYVTGCLGDAALALTILKNTGVRSENQTALFERLDYPKQRIEVGLLLRGLATSAIDISDGLLADLGHILSASGVGARINVDAVPRSLAFKAFVDENADVYEPLNMALSGGDDYELCFTVPADQCAEIETRFKTTGIEVTPIGEIESQTGLRCMRSSGEVWEATKYGYEHFASDRTP